LRSTGACQSAATFSFASARLTQKLRVGVVTFQMSDETPPASASKPASAGSPSSPPRTSAATRRGSGAALADGVITATDG
jgi:hypothetical protein